MKFTWLDKYTRVISMLPPEEAGMLAVALAKYGSLAEEPQDLPFQAQLAFEALREDVEYSRSMTEKGMKSGESRRLHKSYKPNSEIVTNESAHQPQTAPEPDVEPEAPQEANASSTPSEADSAVTDEQPREDSTNDTPLDSRTDKKHEVEPVQEKTANAFKQNARTEHTHSNERVHANSANGAPESTRTKAMHSIALHSKVIEKEKESKEKEIAHPSTEPKSTQPEEPHPKKFQRPTLEQVQAHVSVKGLDVDPERFCAYYDSVGWKIGKQSMKSWQAALRTWDLKAKKDKKEAASTSYQNDFERKVGHDVYEQLAIYN